MVSEDTAWLLERQYLGRAGWFVLSAVAAAALYLVVDGVRMEESARYWTVVALVVPGFTAFVVVLAWSPAGTGFKHVLVGPEGLQVGKRFVAAEDVRTVRVLPEENARGVTIMHRMLGVRVRNTNYALATDGRAIVVEGLRGKRPMLMFRCRDIDGMVELLCRFPHAELVDMEAPLSSRSLRQ